MAFRLEHPKRKKLYDQIGPLLNPVKDKVFRHLASRKVGHNIRGKGETKMLLLKLLATEPKTVLQLMLELNTNASTVRRHLKTLKRQGLVRIIGKNINAFHKSRRTANLWVVT